MAKTKKKEIKATLEELDIDGSLDINITYLQGKKEEWEKKGYFKLYIDQEIDYYYDDAEHKNWLKGYRLETDEELKKRIEISKIRSKAAKKAANTRKIKKEEKEKEIYKRLHEKYDGKVT